MPIPIVQSLALQTNFNDNDLPVLPPDGKVNIVSFTVDAIHSLKRPSLRSGRSRSFQKCP